MHCGAAMRSTARRARCATVRGRSSWCVRARNGQELVQRFSIEVKRPEEDNQLAWIRHRVNRVEAGICSDVLGELHYHPRFGLFLRQTGPVAPDLLRATIESLRGQTYVAWHLEIVADSADGADAVRALLAEVTDDLADRITLIDAADADSDAPFPATDDDMPAWYGTLCPGDELGCNALAEFALAAGLHRETDFLYADEVRRSPASRDREPFFKPDFSPDLLLSTNYIGRPWFAGADLLRRNGITPRNLLSDGDYDLVLRLTERAEAVHHVPKLLAKRGPDALDDDQASRLALVNAVARRGFDAAVLSGCLPGTYRVKRAHAATGKVSIIIPTCAAHGLHRDLHQHVAREDRVPNFEIVCIDNIPASDTSGRPGWRRTPI